MILENCQKGAVKDTRGFSFLWPLALKVIASAETSRAFCLCVMVCEEVSLLQLLHNQLLLHIGSELD